MKMQTFKLVKKVNYALFSGAMALIAVNSYAATANSTAAANIVTPIAITNTQGLSFGDVLAGTSASAIVLSTAGNRTVGSGDATLGATAGTAAAFNVTGQASTAYSVNLPAAAVTLTSGANTMTIDTFTGNGTGVLSAGGSETINVGATLNVGASQAAGAYNGTFVVEAIY